VRRAVLIAALLVSGCRSGPPRTWIHGTSSATGAPAPAHVAPRFLDPESPVERHIASRPTLHDTARCGLRQQALLAGRGGGMTREQVLLVVPPSAVRSASASVWVLEPGQRWLELYFEGDQLVGWTTWEGKGESW
jgi:hypothetical protein